MLFNFSQFSFLGCYEFLSLRNDLSTTGASFERNRWLFGMLRMPPAAIFLQSRVVLIVIVGVVALLLILDMIRFTI